MEESFLPHKKSMLYWLKAVAQGVCSQEKCQETRPISHTRGSIVEKIYITKLLPQSFPLISGDWISRNNIDSEMVCDGGGMCPLCDW